MRQCREAAAHCSDTQTEMDALNKSNEELKRQLADQASEKQRLVGEMTEVRGSYDELVQELKDDISKGDVDVTETDQGVLISVGNQILFASGRAELQAHGRQVLDRVAKVLRKASGRLIEVQGHSDNVPISGALAARFPSNWDLSGARAATVVRTLQSAGVDPANLMLSAFAQYRPMADNATSKGRQENRRVEIWLKPKPAAAHNAH